MLLKMSAVPRCRGWKAQVVTKDSVTIIYLPERQALVRAPGFSLVVSVFWLREPGLFLTPC